MSIAVEHERFILTAKNNSEGILLPTASRCKRDVYQVHLRKRTVWPRPRPEGRVACAGIEASARIERRKIASLPLSLLSKGGWR